MALVAVKRYEQMALVASHNYPVTVCVIQNTYLPLNFRQRILIVTTKRAFI